MMELQPPPNPFTQEALRENGKHGADWPLSSPTRPPCVPLKGRERALHTGSSASATPPDSPGREPPAQEAPARSGFFFGSLLRSQSEKLPGHRRSASFDGRERPAAAQNGHAAAEAQPAAVAEGAKPRRMGRHQRSLSSGLPAQAGRLAPASPDREEPREAISRTTSGSMVKRILSAASCVAQPRVDEGPAQPPPPPPRPHAPLCNPGNQCFLVAMVQALLVVPELAPQLWASFPDVPPPPPPPQPEPLSEFVPANIARAAAAAAAKQQAAGAAAGGQPEGGCGEAARSQAASPRSSLDGTTSSDASPEDEQQALGSALPSRSSDEGTTASVSPPPASDRWQQASCAPAGTAQQLSDGSTPAGAASAPDSLAGDTPPAGSPRRADAGAEPPADAGAAAVGPAAAPDGRQQSWEAGAQRDQRVWAMSRRAAAADPDEPVASRTRRLAQALAFVMAQMCEEGEGPRNPFPAMWAAARHPQLAELVDGNQHDTHELFVSLTDALTDVAQPHAEAGGRLADLFAGATRTLTECKKCHETKARPAEGFTDLCLPPVAKSNGSLSVASSLAAFFSEALNPDVACSRCCGPEAAQKAAAVSKTYLGKLQGVFAARPSEARLWERPRLQTVPRVLALHFKRHDVVPLSPTAGSQGAPGVRVRKVGAAVKVDLALSLDKVLVEAGALQAPEGGEGSSSSAGSGPAAPPASEAPPAPAASYRLVAAIFHRGLTPVRGHYYAMCRVGPSDDDWFKFDDHHPPARLAPRAGALDPKYLCLHEAERREVCMLFYERAPPRPRR